MRSSVAICALLLVLASFGFTVPPAVCQNDEPSAEDTVNWLRSKLEGLEATKCNFGPRVKCYGYFVTSIELENDHLIVEAVKRIDYSEHMHYSSVHWYDLELEETIIPLSQISTDVAFREASNGVYLILSVVGSNDDRILSRVTKFRAGHKWLSDSYVGSIEMEKDEFCLKENGLGSIKPFLPKGNGASMQVSNYEFFASDRDLAIRIKNALVHLIELHGGRKEDF